MKSSGCKKHENHKIELHIVKMYCRNLGRKCENDNRLGNLQRVLFGSLGNAEIYRFANIQGDLKVLAAGNMPKSTNENLTNHRHSHRHNQIMKLSWGQPCARSGPSRRPCGGHLGVILSHLGTISGHPGGHHGGHLGAILGAILEPSWSYFKAMKEWKDEQ